MVPPWLAASPSRASSHPVGGMGFRMVGSHLSRAVFMKVAGSESGLVGVMTRLYDPGCSAT